MSFIYLLIKETSSCSGHGEASDNHISLGNVTVKKNHELYNNHYERKECPAFETLEKAQTFKTKHDQHNLLKIKKIELH